MPLQPDDSPLPVELLTLGHSKLYMRRMHHETDDYEDIDEISPPPVPPKPVLPLKRSSKVDSVGSIKELDEANDKDAIESTGNNKTR